MSFRVKPACARQALMNPEPPGYMAIFLPFKSATVVIPELARAIMERKLGPPFQIMRMRCGPPHCSVANSSTPKIARYAEPRWVFQNTALRSFRATAWDMIKSTPMNLSFEPRIFSNSCSTPLKTIVLPDSMELVEPTIVSGYIAGFATSWGASLVPVAKANAAAQNSGTNRTNSLLPITPSFVFRRY